MQLMDCGNGSQINVYTFPELHFFVVVVHNHLGDVAAEEEVVARGWRVSLTMHVMFKTWLCLYNCRGLLIR